MPEMVLKTQAELSPSVVDQSDESLMAPDPGMCNVRAGASWMWMKWQERKKPRSRSIENLTKIEEASIDHAVNPLPELMGCSLGCFTPVLYSEGSPLQGVS